VRRINFAGEIVSNLIALIILCVVLSIASPYFFTMKNILNFLMNASLLGIMTSGLFVAMVIGAIDVSQYAVLALSSAIMVIFIRGGMQPGPAILVSVVVAFACGAINGSLVAFLRINPIIATLGTTLIYRGFAYRLTEARMLTVTGSVFSVVGSGRFLGIPVSVFIMLGIFLFMHAMLSYTSRGKRVYAVGGNAQAAYISGISVRMVRFWGMIVSAIAASIAGLLYVSELGATVPTVGEGGLLDVVAAIVIGGIGLSGGKGRIVGALIGVLILAVLQNGLVLLSVQSYYQIIVKGAVILLAVLVDSIRGGGYK
jgi:ribose transport system permease protein